MRDTRNIAARSVTRCLAALVVLLLAGCSPSPTTAESRFAQRIGELLADRSTVVVPAARLTDFKWDALCFERADELLLTFRGSDPALVFHLGYDDYFVDEPYVEKSLADRCVAAGDAIVVKRKHPQGALKIEFQSVD